MIDQKGSAIVETLLALPLVLTLTILVFFVSYVEFEKIWLHFHGHEALACYNQAHPRDVCTSWLKKRLQLTNLTRQPSQIFVTEQSRSTLLKIYQPLTNQHRLKWVGQKIPGDFGL